MYLTNEAEFVNSKNLDSTKHFHNIIITYLLGLKIIKFTLSGCIYQAIFTKFGAGDGNRTRVISLEG